MRPPVRSSSSNSRQRHTGDELIELCGFFVISIKFYLLSEVIYTIYKLTREIISSRINIMVHDFNYNTNTYINQALSFSEYKKNMMLPVNRSIIRLSVCS